MIFNSKNTVYKCGKYIFASKVLAKANSALLNPIFEEFWKGFTYQLSEISFEETKDFVFYIGQTEVPDVGENAYAITVTPSGVCVAANDRNGLIMGFMTLIDKIRSDDFDHGVAAYIDCFELKESPLIKNRMVHFCIFPETQLWEVQRYVRMAGALKYSHLILEFWGMLKYDCMKELAWSCAYTKEDFRPIVDEAKALGLEIIPMFNHWGHATASRVMNGKHVVLDQNPSLQSYFTTDGWCWDIKKPKVKALLRSIREELIDLCGEGGYFHIGCDEAYNYELTLENIDFISNYINEVNEEVRACGRRTIVWGDMLLYRYPHYNSNNRYHCGAPSAEAANYFISRLDKSLVIADWQYNSNEAPVETAFVFLEAGFDTLICPWDRSLPRLNSCVKTAKENNMFGIIHTTWHTLSFGAPFILLASVNCFEDNPDYDSYKSQTYSAALMRKVMPSEGAYERSGWSKRQTNDIFTFTD